MISLFISRLWYYVGLYDISLVRMGGSVAHFASGQSFTWEGKSMRGWSNDGGIASETVVMVSARA